jgi:hypothetical protein
MRHGGTAILRQSAATTLQAGRPVGPVVQPPITPQTTDVSIGVMAACIPTTLEIYVKAEIMRP